MPFSVVLAAAQASESSGITESASGIAALLGGLAALTVLLSSARAGLRATVGRRWDHYRRIARLGTGAHLSFFASALGQPPAVQRKISGKEIRWEEAEGEDEPPVVETEYTEAFFIDRDYYVQAVADDDGTVLAFSITARSPRFHPRFRPTWRPGPIERWRYRRDEGERFRHLYDVTLGRTRFDRAIAWSDSLGRVVKTGTGARSWSYSEAHYLGNPGFYQTFVLTASSATRVGRFANEDLQQMQQILGGVEQWSPDPMEPADSSERPAVDALRRLRRHSVITTITLIGGRAGHDEVWMPTLWFGPHEDDLRTLP